MLDLPWKIYLLIFNCDLYYERHLKQLLYFFEEIHHLNPSLVLLDGSELNTPSSLHGCLMGLEEKLSLRFVKGEKSVDAPFSLRIREADFKLTVQSEKLRLWYSNHMSAGETESTRVVFITTIPYRIKQIQPGG